MDVFDQMNDPGCAADREIDQLRANLNQLTARLVAVENERDDALRSLNLLSMLMQGFAASIIDTAQSMAPGAPRPHRVPPELAAELVGGNDPEMVAPVLNLPVRPDRPRSEL